MQFDKDKMVLTINGEEHNFKESEKPDGLGVRGQVDVTLDEDGWRQFSGQTMRLYFESGRIIEFEAYNIREVEEDQCSD